MKQYVRTFSATVALLCAVPLTASLVSTERQAAFATYQDIEPAIISQVRSGVEHQVIAWMEFTADGTGNPPTKFKFSHHSNGNQHLGSLGLVTGYTGYADPLLAQNTSTQRIYLVGLAHNASLTLPSAVIRWYSDNGGQTWSAAGVVTSVTPSGSTLILDKPTIAVAPNGYVYVAYTRRTGTQHQLNVHVSTDHGANWNGPFTVNASSTNFPASQIMVDSNGDVYVVWSRWIGAVDELRVARATAYNPTTNTLTFTEATGSMVTAGNILNGSEYLGCGTDCSFRAASVPMTKLDPIRRRIGVTWHARNANGGVEINFRTISIATTTPTWQPGITFWNGGNDVQPALDFDTAGNFLVSYYAFVPLNSPTYYNVARYITFSGNMPVIEDAGQNVHTLNGVISDVSQYPSLSGDGRRLLGEYHDVHFSNGTFKTVGIQIVTYGNPYVFTTTHN